MTTDRDPMDWVKLAGVILFAVLLVLAVGTGLLSDSWPAAR